MAVLTVDVDKRLVSLPFAEVHLVARLGPMARDGLDLHVVGPRQRVHRKLVRGGSRAILAPLPLGACARVFGVPASSLTDQIVRLEELWDAARIQRLRDAVIDNDAALAAAVAATPNALATEAARRLATASVHSVADQLGVSERHLRRIFHDAVGLAPKAYAKLARFHRALAHTERDWASVAVAAGYYDQAHLIAEFRSIAGVTPSVLRDELHS